MRQTSYKRRTESVSRMALNRGALYSKEPSAYRWNGGAEHALFPQAHNTGWAGWVPCYGSVEDAHANQVYRPDELAELLYLPVAWINSWIQQQKLKPVAARLNSNRCFVHLYSPQHVLERRGVYPSSYKGRKLPVYAQRVPREGLVTVAEVSKRTKYPVATVRNWLFRLKLQPKAMLLKGKGNWELLYAKEELVKPPRKGAKS